MRRVCVCVLTAAAQIGAEELRVEPYKAKEAMIKWARPSPPNGPISMYVTEYVILEKDETVISVKNDTVPATKTMTILQIECSGQSRLVDVRVRAVTTVRGHRFLADFSEWRRAIMCRDPGIHFIYIPPANVNDGNSHHRTGAQLCTGAAPRGARHRCSRRRLCTAASNLSNFCFRCLCQCPLLHFSP